MEEAASGTEFALAGLHPVAAGRRLIIRMNRSERSLAKLLRQGISRPPQLVVTVRELAEALERAIAVPLIMTAQLGLITLFQLVEVVFILHRLLLFFELGDPIRRIEVIL